MSIFAHLLPQVATRLALSDEERVHFIHKDRWIGYSKARDILDRMDDLLMYPKRHRMPNLLLYGDTNNGKTMILRKFLELHPPDINIDGDSAIIPILLVQCPLLPDEAGFYRVILDTLAAPYRSIERADNLQYQVLSLLRQVGTRVLVLDEIQHVLASNSKKQHEFINVIKNLSNELMIPIVGVGTRNALRALQDDPQIANRFEPITLPKWTMDHEYLRLLASFEKVLPLKKPSFLTDDALAQKLLTMSEGFIGELTRILTAAAQFAIESETEQITLKTLQLIGWINPSERRKAAEKESSS